MKKVLILILSIIMFVGCDNDDDNQTNDFLVNGKWDLTEIQNTSVGGITIPDNSNTHYYQINTDRTFKRVSIKDNKSEEQEGTYILTDENINYDNEDNAIQKFVELSYSSDAIFFNCGIIDKNKQLLILNSDNKLQNTLSGACDGENYEYTKEN